MTRDRCRTGPSRWGAAVLAAVLLMLDLPSAGQTDRHDDARPAPIEVSLEADTLPPPDSSVEPVPSPPAADIVPILSREPADASGAFHIIAAGRDAWSTTLPPPSPR